MIIKTNTINGSTSGGMQYKYINNRMFYKIDSLGVYESLAEVLVSELEEYIENFPHANYYLCEPVVVGEDTKRACYCNSVIPDGYTEVSLYKLLSKEVDVSKLYDKYVGLELVRRIINTINNITDGYDMKEYLGRVLFLDAITLNEDRHLNNLSLMFSKGVIKPMPVIDNGLSLLSDLNKYPLRRSTDSLIRTVKSKPFSSSFSKQVRYFKDVEPLVIDIDSFYSKMDVVMSNLDEYIYTGSDVFRRMYSVLCMRLNHLEGMVWVRK